MNIPQVFTKIKSSKNINEGSVCVGCNLEGVTDINRLRAIVNHEDPVVIGAKYQDRFQNWDEYPN